MFSYATVVRPLSDDSCAPLPPSLGTALHLRSLAFLVAPAQSRPMDPEASAAAAAAAQEPCACVVLPKVVVRAGVHEEVGGEEGEGCDGKVAV